MPTLQQPSDDDDESLIAAVRARDDARRAHFRGRDGRWWTAQYGPACVPERAHACTCAVCFGATDAVDDLAVAALLHWSAA